MHTESMALMKWALRTYTTAPGSLVDVGAYDVNGNHRSLVKSAGFTYQGLDVVPGPNVDALVDASLLDWGMQHGLHDVVISANTMEHVQNPFTWMRQMGSLMKPDAVLIIHTLWQHPIHYHPIDCFRILPDGMRAITKDVGLHIIRVGRTHYENGNGDTILVASRQPAAASNRKTFRLADGKGGRFVLCLERHQA